MSRIDYIGQNSNEGTHYEYTLKVKQEVYLHAANLRNEVNIIMASVNKSFTPYDAFAIQDILNNIVMLIAKLRVDCKANVNEELEDIADKAYYGYINLDGSRELAQNVKVTFFEKLNLTEAKHSLDTLSSCLPNSDKDCTLHNLTISITYLLKAIITSKSMDNTRLIPKAFKEIYTITKEALLTQNKEVR